MTKKLVTHNGGFHTDDVFACATLQLLLDKKGESYEIIRTRDEEIISNGDYVFDVGGVYDPAAERFDHHQASFTEKRENTIPYAAFGLVWKKFGSELTESQEVSDRIDQFLVQGIDAIDNGVQLSNPIHEGVGLTSIQSIVSSYQPTWNEDFGHDEAFLKAVEWAKQVISRKIKTVAADLEAEEIVRKAYDKSEDKKIIVIDQPVSQHSAWQVLVDKTEPLFVVRPNSAGAWRAVANRVTMDSFASRLQFPESWRGKMKADLVEACGIKGAKFCHNGGFLCAAETKEAAIALAQAAIDA